jgi:hypothetical protein
MSHVKRVLRSTKGHLLCKIRPPNRGSQRWRILDTLPSGSASELALVRQTSPGRSDEAGSWWVDFFPIT